MERNENSTLRSLRACRDIMDQLFKKYDARIFNTAGDSVLAEFQSAVTALVCATEFQKMINNDCRCDRKEHTVNQILKSEIGDRFKVA